MTLDSFVQDLVLGFRSLRRDRGYASVVILTLAFGIAANTVVFSLLNPYFLRPLPFQAEDRLESLHQRGVLVRGGVHQQGALFVDRQPGPARAETVQGRFR